MIYYLKTSTPHEEDISISGPYCPLDAVADQVLHNFGQACTEGQYSRSNILSTELLMINVQESILSETAISTLTEVSTTSNTSPHQ